MSYQPTDPYNPWTHHPRVFYIDTISDLPGWTFWLAMFGFVLGFAVYLWWAKRRSPSGRRWQTSPRPRCRLCGEEILTGYITIHGGRYLCTHCPKCDIETVERAK